MKNVKGTQGYGADVDRFIFVTEEVDFEELHQPYLGLIPTEPSRVLDTGAGVGRDSAVLASMGHSVVAVEPMPEFLDAARRLHDSPNIQWVHDSLPELEKLGDELDQFDFVLASAVWHHINMTERTVAMSRIADLVRTGGILAMSLRNGPVGAGTHTFPTDYNQTIESAIDFGFKMMLALTDQPSLIAGKGEVKWSKLAFKRL